MVGPHIIRLLIHLRKNLIFLPLMFQMGKLLPVLHLLLLHPFHRLPQLLLPPLKKWYTRMQALSFFKETGGGSYWSDASQWNNTWFVWHISFFFVFSVCLFVCFFVALFHFFPVHSCVVLLTFMTWRARPCRVPILFRFPICFRALMLRNLHVSFCFPVTVLLLTFLLELFDYFLGAAKSAPNFSILALTESNIQSALTSRPTFFTIFIESGIVRLNTDASSSSVSGSQGGGVDQLRVVVYSVSVIFIDFSRFTFFCLAFHWFLVQKELGIWTCHFGFERS